MIESVILLRGRGNHESTHRLSPCATWRLRTSAGVVHRMQFSAVSEMRRPLAFVLFLVAALGVLSFAEGDAFAYCHKSTCNPQKEDCEKDEYDCVSSGRGVAWTALPIPYRFHAGGSQHFDDSDLRTTVRRAFRTWESVECEDGPTSLVFKQGKDITSDPEQGEAAPLDFGIYFRDDVWPEQASDIALSRVNAFARNGMIAGANIEVNTAQKTFRLSATDRGEFDLESVLIHEVGHYLGLDHSSDPDSIMVTNYCNGESPCSKSTDALRTLGEDDIAAVCRLYPPKRTNPPQQQGCATSSRPASVPVAIVPSVALLLACLTRLTRRLRGERRGAARRVG